jgi:hypothetical protein
MDKAVKKIMDNVPKSVAMVALGPSFYDYFRECIGQKGRADRFNEVWVVNRGFRAFKHDRAFIMDDLKWLEGHDEFYADAIRKHDKPVITSTKYPGYKNAVEYPIKEILDNVGDDLFNNTCVYMIAYAMYIGVEEMSIYGFDFHYDNLQSAEEGGQAVGYMLGIARARGHRISLPQSTSLLSANSARMYSDGTVRRPLYGYHRKPEGLEGRPEGPLPAIFGEGEHAEPIIVDDQAPVAPEDMFPIKKSAKLKAHEAAKKEEADATNNKSS